MEEQSPSSLGFSMPPEWAKHEATWVSWPKNPLTFTPDLLPQVEAAYVEMIEGLARGERVDILVDDQRSEDRVRSMVSAKRLRFHHIKSADVWMRDYGPIFVKKKSGLAATKWRFNAWGNKYDDLLVDDTTGAKVAKAAGLRVFEPGIVLEGGSIDSNGDGTLLTTEQCLLNKNRNPRLSKLEIEGFLRDYLGASKVVWLKRGVEGDDTDGHVDDIARFVGPQKVVCMTEAKSSPNKRVLRQNQEILSKHEGLQVELIDMPRDLPGDEGMLPASYANFYIGNSVVLVPVFGDEKRDDAAVEKLSASFKGRTVIPVDCKALVSGFGGIHCVTQQQPALAG